MCTLHTTKKYDDVSTYRSDHSDQQTAVVGFLECLSVVTPPWPINFCCEAIAEDLEPDALCPLPSQPQARRFGYNSARRIRCASAQCSSIFHDCTTKFLVSRIGVLCRRIQSSAKRDILSHMKIAA